MGPVSCLLGCDDLAPLILRRTMRVASAVYSIQLTPPQAIASRNALAKAVYGLLFDQIVTRVNGVMAGDAVAGHESIGLLDVFGFESFETNSFEQLAINFANEKLHQVMIWSQHDVASASV